MFGKLKDKLKSWTKKISEDAEVVEEVEQGEVVEELDEDLSKLKKVADKKADKVREKKKKSKKEESGKIVKDVLVKEEPIVDEIKEVEVPMRYVVGAERFEPDLEEISDIVDEKVKKDKEINIPQKFNVGSKSFEADFEELENVGKKLEKVEVIKEEIKKEKAEKEPNEKPGTEGFFKRVTSKISKVKITEKEFEVYQDDLEMLLLENNVALEVAEKVIAELKERIVGREFLKREVESEIQDFFREVIEEILLEPYDFAERVKEGEKPYVILFCGVNGTGKTTTIAKVAEYLKKNGLSCVLAAGDTFRAASIEQLKTHGERLSVKVVAHDYGSDPASVGYDTISYAKKNKIDCVLIDTAGRMHTAKNLLKEMEKIVKVCKPDLKIFVGESITGNDILEQVRSFDWAIGVDGVVLSKADIDEKGGTALSVGYVTKKPILYLGTGQEYDKFEPFNRKKFITRLGL
ncbi:MAG: signal recognition particle-docking protein FtsY [Candidatus Pacearchaeota archaeon]|nr:signal recognition particle-docking protein FtsY [Candidatus Pacearchaeota archaeon]